MTQPIAASAAAVPTAPYLVPNSMVELDAAVKAGSARLVLGDASDDAKVAECLREEARKLGSADAKTFQRDPASGRLLVVELVGERKRAYVRLCRSSGVKFIVRTSDAHQTFYARGFKPRGKASGGRAATAAPAGALDLLVKTPELPVPDEKKGKGK